MELYAKIKPESKYAHQGVDPRSGKRIFFPITEVRDDWYAFQTDYNQYRLEDLTFYVRSPSGRFIRLS